MTVPAILFMIISVSFVISLAIWCYYQLLFKGDRNQGRDQASTKKSSP